MIYIGVDPGPEISAFVVWDGEKIIEKHLIENKEILGLLRWYSSTYPANSFLIIEKIESFGMPVGKSVFETVFWAGRFRQEWRNHNFYYMPRKEAKLNLCNSCRAKDANVRQRLIDIYGPPGTKKKPGTLYGLKKDLWSAFALIAAYKKQELPF